MNKRAHQPLAKYLLPLLFLFCVFTNADARTFTWEHISGYMSSPPYGWTYSYDIGFYDNTLKIDVDIKIAGYAPDASLLHRWKSGIENIWSTDIFTIPILFNVDWVTSDYDFIVNILDGPGNWDMINWYTKDAGGWGDVYQEEIAAHEYGHMISMWDEYTGGAVNPDTGLINTGGLMHTLNGSTLDFYYFPFIRWYEDKITEVQPVPEPATFLLFVTGIAGIMCKQIRRKFNLNYM